MFWQPKLRFFSPSFLVKSKPAIYLFFLSIFALNLFKPGYILSLNIFSIPGRCCFFYFIKNLFSQPQKKFFWEHFENQKRLFLDIQNIIKSTISKFELIRCKIQWKKMVNCEPLKRSKARLYTLELHILIVFRKKGRSAYWTICETDSELSIIIVIEKLSCIANEEKKITQNLICVFQFLRKN